MTRLGADLRHVRQHVNCTVRTGTGRRCAAMTNYVCTRCGDGLCGRHDRHHWCAEPAVAR